MEWVEFKDKLPEPDRLILLGNHRWVDTCLYDPDYYKIVEAKLNYKNVTHWCYIDLPPVVEWESKWTSTPDS